MSRGNIFESQLSYTETSPIQANRVGFKIAYRLLRTERAYLNKCRMIIENDYLSRYGAMFADEFIRLGYSHGARTKKVCTSMLFKAVCYAYQSAEQGRHIDETVKNEL